MFKEWTNAINSHTANNSNILLERDIPAIHLENNIARNVTILKSLETDPADSLRIRYNDTKEEIIYYGIKEIQGLNEIPPKSDDLITLTFSYNFEGSK